jgi:hypothetical protein
MYQKVGMFGLVEFPGINPFDNRFKGDQIRGFGFLHDGAVDTLFRFHNATLFNQGPGNPNGFPLTPAGDQARRQVEALMFAFPSNLDAAVGQQTTRTSLVGYPGVGGRITALIARADSGLCDVVVKGRVDGEERGYLYVGGGLFASDRANEPPIDANALANEANVAGQELTYTCVPPGSGTRIGLDRDRDTFGDTDETDASTDPSDPASFPSAGTPLCSSRSTGYLYKNAKVVDHNGKLTVVARDLPLGTYNQESVSVRVAGLLLHSSYGGIIPGPSMELRGRSYKYRAPAGSTGIIRVVVKENRRAPGLFTVTLKTKLAWPAGTFVETIGTTEVQVNVGGECFVGNATKVVP